MVTENKLQAQIIQLQSTVINVLQDALSDGRDLSQSDRRRIVAAQNAAREGSLDALEGRSRRMLAQKRPSSRASLDYERSDDWDDEDRFAPIRRQQTLPAPPPSQRSRSLPRRSRTLPIDSGSLFCPYSEQLQYNTRTLDSAFDPSGDGHCPSCSTTLNIIHEAIVPLDGQSYRLNQRYFVKSHMPDGRFACVLCARNRDVDAICSNVTALAKHIAGTHTSEEAQRDLDLIVVEGAGVRPKQRLLEYA